MALGKSNNSGRTTATDSRNNKLTKSSNPPPNKKKTKHVAKRRIKFHSETCGTNGGDASNNNNNAEFPKLDASKPEHARRIQQRRRMICYGKNTVGYEIYTSKVPKEQRRPRSMETPSTPDHTLDIPNKRWIGQIRAWRRALHKYDPEDLQKSMATELAPAEENGADMLRNELVSVRDREVAQAKAAGLLVAFDDVATAAEVSPSVSGTTASSADMTAVDTATSSSSSNGCAEMNELDRWDVARGDDAVLCSEDEDSDDDLL